MTISEKTNEIAQDFAALTGRMPGWAVTLTIEDYARFRKMALEEIGIPGSSSCAVQQPSQTTVQYIPQPMPQPMPQPVPQPAPQPAPQKIQQTVPQNIQQTVQQTVQQAVPQSVQQAYRTVPEERPQPQQETQPVPMTPDIRPVQAQGQKRSNKDILRSLGR